MRLYDLKKLIDAEVLTGEDKLELDYQYAFGSDLMSDVLALVNKDTLLLTGLTNIQAVRTAEMMDIKCIVFVRGKHPDTQVINLAAEKDICLMSTPHIMFTSCGILYTNGLRGVLIK